MRLSSDPYPTPKAPDLGAFGSAALAKLCRGAQDTAVTNSQKNLEEYVQQTSPLILQEARLDESRLGMTGSLFGLRTTKSLGPRITSLSTNQLAPEKSAG